MTTLQTAILEALDVAGRERNQSRHAELFWEALTERVSPVNDWEVERELKGLFSGRRAA